MKGADGRVYVLIPVGKDVSPPIEGFECKGLVTKIHDRKYLTIIPPSSEIIHVQELSEAEFNDALNHVLVDLSELAESVESSIVGEYVVVKIRKPRGHVASWRFRNVLGSLEASIAASLLAKKCGIIRIVDEIDMEDERVITLETFQHG